MSIKDLLIAAFRMKWLIVSLTLLGSGAGALYAYSKPNLYRSTVMVISSKGVASNASALGGGGLGGLASLMGVNLRQEGDSTSDLALVIMKASPFLTYYSKITMFKNDIDKIEGSDATSRYEEKDYAAYIGSLLWIKKDPATGTIEITAISKSPQLSHRVASTVTDSLNSFIREDTIERYAGDIVQFQLQLSETPQDEIKRTIFAMISERMHQVALAKSRKDFVFRVIEPPELPKYKSSPRRTLIIGAAAAVSFTGATILALILHQLGIIVNGPLDVGRLFKKR